MTRSLGTHTYLVVKQTQYEGIARAPDRTRIAVQVRGDGSPLLLLPGRPTITIDGIWSATTLRRTT
jgi:hypothetical protein